MIKRRLVLITSICLLVGIFAIGGSLAWLADEDEARNTISIGNVTIDLREDNWDPEEGLHIYPGKVTEKDPIVHNIGANPAYIRVKVLYPSEFNEFLKFNFDEVNWFKEGNYYYYKKNVPVLGKTTALFTQFELLDTYIEPPIGQEATFDIDIYAEAIQSEGFEPIDSTNAAFRTAILTAFSEYDGQNP